MENFTTSPSGVEIVRDQLPLIIHRTETAFCTIVTPDYFFKAVTLLSSLRSLGISSPFIVLLTGELPSIPIFEGVRVMRLSELMDDDLAWRAIARYRRHPDKLRWTLKSTLLRLLIQGGVAKRVIYCDSDMYFAAPPQELVSCLDHAGIVVTPHWRPPHPEEATRNFRLSFLDGLFNAGCVGSNVDGIPALLWWNEACLAACEKNYEKGLYYDQRYLDLLVVYFPEITALCFHRGYNLADWNVWLRQSNPSGLRLVPERWPVVLIHFTTNTIAKITAGQDPVLEPFYQVYTSLISEALNHFQRNKDDGSNLLLNKLATP